MAVPTEPRLTLSTGSRRVGTTASSRSWFAYLTPTGAQLPLNQCPVIKREYVRNNGRFGSTDFEAVTSYFLRGEGSLLFVSITSSFGKPNTVVRMVTDIGTDYELIEFVGPNECGRFYGRGRINLESSVIIQGKSPIEVTVEVLQDSFKYKVYQAAKSAKASKSRSLIF